MKNILKIFLSIALFIPLSLIAQLTDPPPLPESLQNISLTDSARKIFISSVNISGNKKTKDYIIRRELLLKPGDSISAGSLYETIKASQSLVYNTTLFTSVTTTAILINGDSINLNVAVSEKWYIYPTPQFQLVDRNFNEWLNTYNADLDRVIYGAKFVHYNFSGRRDALRLYLLTGYARNISFSYSAPYSNPALTEGFTVAASYTENREIPYATNYNNKLLQYNNGGFVRKQFSIGGSYIARRGYYKRHVISALVNHINVLDSVVKNYNTNYFNSEKNKHTFPEFGYTFQYVNTDNIAYPLKGRVASISVLKRGFGLENSLNLLETSGSYSWFIPHKKNWFSSVTLMGKIKAPFDLAYINQRALGYGDMYLRGLEYYVIDGYAAAVAKYTLKKKVVSFNIPVPFKIKAIPSIPFSIFAKTYGDAGISVNRKELNTRLNNRLLYSGGFGIDILTLYDINLKIEYSFNQLGGNGLFLHTSGGF